MKGFVYVSGDTVLRNDRLEFSIRLILECNPLVKASKKKIERGCPKSAMFSALNLSRFYIGR
jgi:hypothetical protein